MQSMRKDWCRGPVAEQIVCGPCPFTWASQCQVKHRDMLIHDKLDAALREMCRFLDHSVAELKEMYGSVEPLLA